MINHHFVWIQHLFVTNFMVYPAPRPQGSLVVTQWVTSTGSVRLLFPEEEDDPSPGTPLNHGDSGDNFFGGEHLKNYMWTISIRIIIESGWEMRWTSMNEPRSLRIGRVGKIEAGPFGHPVYHFLALAPYVFHDFYHSRHCMGRFGRSRRRLCGAARRGTDGRHGLCQSLWAKSLVMLAMFLIFLDALRQFKVIESIVTSSNEETVTRPNLGTQRLKHNYLYIYIYTKHIYIY